MDERSRVLESIVFFEKFEFSLKSVVEYAAFKFSMKTIKKVFQLLLLLILALLYVPSTATRSFLAVGFVSVRFHAPQLR